MNPPHEERRALAVVLHAWVGPDELGIEEEYGLKQASTPAGMVPLVSCREGQLEQPYLVAQMQRQADEYGVTIRLVRFVAVEVVAELEPTRGTLP